MNLAHMGSIVRWWDICRIEKILDVLARGARSTCPVAVSCSWLSLRAILYRSNRNQY